MTTFDVNQLHSYVFVLSSDRYASVSITDSHFIGGFSAVDISGGTFNASNSQFESMTISILIDSADSVEITECTFRIVGELHGPFIGLGSFGAYGIVDVSDSEYVSMPDSVFRTYAPGGLVVWTENDEVIMNGNEFEIDSDGYFTDFYDLNISDLEKGPFNWQWAAVAFKYCEGAEITENVFTINDVDSSTPWIYLYENTGTTCLSANKFGDVWYSMISVMMLLTSTEIFGHFL